MTATERIQARARAQEADRSEAAGQERAEAYEERLEELAKKMSETPDGHHGPGGDDWWRSK